MCSKNTLLFFCVALYFSNCHGAKTTPEELEMIRNAFVQQTNIQCQRVGVENLKKIIDDVAEKSGTSREPPSLEHLISQLKDDKFTLDEVEWLTKEYLINQDPKITELVRNAFAQHTNRTKIVDVNGLKKIIDEVVKKSGTSRKPPSLGELIMQHKDGTFTMDEVECIAQEYLLSHDPKVMKLISNTVQKYKSTISLDLRGVKDVIKEVADSTGIFKCISSSLDELQTEASTRIFTMNEVERIAKEFVIFQDPKLKTIIREIVKKYERPDGIKYDGVNSVIEDVAKMSGLPKEFPSLDELQTTISNRTFTTDQVERIANEFLAFQDPKLKGIIRDLFEKHRKPDGINIEELMGLIREVTMKTGTSQKIPSIDELKTAITNCKFTVEEVESIASDYLFL